VTSYHHDLVSRRRSKPLPSHRSPWLCFPSCSCSSSSSAGSALSCASARYLRAGRVSVCIAHVSLPPRRAQAELTSLLLPPLLPPLSRRLRRPGRRRDVAEAAQPVLQQCVERADAEYDDTLARLQRLEHRLSAKHATQVVHVTAKPLRERFLLRIPSHPLTFSSLSFSPCLPTGLVSRG